jgi:hypothetical protein
MKDLIAVPILALAYMLQTAVINRITLLSGSADIILLILVAWALQEQVKSAWLWAGLAGMMGAFVSGLPPFVLLIAYMLIVTVARYVLYQTWQTPVLALLTVTFLATILLHFITYITLILTGAPIPFADSLAMITMPSIFLNLLLALPVHSFIKDLAFWVYPQDDLV